MIVYLYRMRTAGTGIVLKYILPLLSIVSRFVALNINMHFFLYIYFLHYIIL